MTAQKRDYECYGCEHLCSDGTHDLLACDNNGCDVSMFKQCAFCDVEGNWQSDEPQSVHVWTCEKCDCYFCESCFEKQHGLKALRSITECETDALCPNCYKDYILKVEADSLQEAIKIFTSNSEDFSLPTGEEQLVDYIESSFEMTAMGIEAIAKI